MDSPGRMRTHAKHRQVWIDVRQTQPFLHASLHCKVAKAMPQHGTSASERSKMLMLKTFMKPSEGYQGAQFALEAAFSSSQCWHQMFRPFPPSWCSPAMRKLPHSLGTVGCCDIFVIFPSIPHCQHHALTLESSVSHFCSSRCQFLSNHGRTGRCERTMEYTCEHVHAMCRSNSRETKCSNSEPFVFLLS